MNKDNQIYFILKKYQYMTGVDSIFYEWMHPYLFVHQSKALSVKSFLYSVYLLFGLERKFQMYLFLPFINEKKTYT